MSDPRHNRPSASSFGRLEACPASWALEQEARRQGLVPPAGDDAESGQRIHAYLATGDGWEALTMAEQDTAARCEVSEREVAEQWGNEGAETYSEIRLGMTAFGTVIEVKPETKAALLFTGQFDSAWISGERGIVLDYKTGRGETESAEGNRQLLALAVLVAGWKKLKQVRVAIVQPWAGKPSVADYDEDALAAAKEWALRTARVCDSACHEGPNPGQWCHYCPAKLVCPAIKKGPTEALAAVNVETLPAGKEKEAVFARLHEMTGDDLAELKEKLKKVRWLEASLDGVIKQKLEADPHAVPGWELKEREGKRTVTDTGAAYEAIGLTPEQFLPCCTVSMTKLEEAVRIASGHKMNKDGSKSTRSYVLTAEKAKEAVNAKLAPLMTRKKTLVLQECGAQLEDPND